MFYWANHRLDSREVSETQNPQKNNLCHVKHKPWSCNNMSFIQHNPICSAVWNSNMWGIVNWIEIGPPKRTKNKMTYKEGCGCFCASVVQLSWVHWVHHRNVESENKPRKGLEGKKKNKHLKEGKIWMSCFEKFCVGIWLLVYVAFVWWAINSDQQKNCYKREGFGGLGPFPKGKQPENQKK